MELCDYLASLRGKRVAAIGAGVSNTPLIRLLAEAGADVTVCDKNPHADLSALEALGVRKRLGPDYLKDLDFDVVFRTPGLHPDLLRGAQGRAVITSEMELFFQVCPCPIIAITGSDGKTTTTTIIASLLREAGRRVHLGGNIGTPLLAQAPEMEADDIAVLELSSFQLLTMRQSPDIAVVVNVAPNHLDVHTSMDEYVSAKANIFRHQGENGIVVLNYDNAITRAFSKDAPGKVTFFSRQPLEGAVVLRDGVIYSGERPVLPVNEIRLRGAHNVENYMAVIGAVDGLVPDEMIRRFAATFAGVEHRIELVRQVGGVSYYNDSIASSPSRAIAALDAFDQKTILIAGGRDKKVPFDELGAAIVQKVKTLVLTGEAAQQIRAAVERAPGYEPGAVRILMEDDFTQAVLAAARAADSEGDIVLLSPGCTSFDRFDNFAARGALFKRIVNDL